jgi:hypothetical protein
LTESTSHAIRITEPDRRVSFADVTRSHWEWDQASNGAANTATAPAAGADVLKTAFDNMLAAFESSVDPRDDADVRVVDSYWSSKHASGVALFEINSSSTLGPIRRTAKALRLWHPLPEYRIYRESDWITVEYSALASLLHECDVLAIKARWGLEGLHQAVVMPWLMAVERHVFGFIERDWLRVTRSPNGDGSKARGEKLEEGHSAEVERGLFHKEVVRELNRIEDYYQQAGSKRARLHFVSAMVTLGLAIVVVAAAFLAGVLALFGLLHLHDPAIRRLYAAIGAGAIGAIVSVLMRMSGVGRNEFKIDHELGAGGVRRLGALRPLVGAVCGAVIALLVQTTLVAGQHGAATATMAFVIVIAFLAGFSERWTKVMLDGAMRTVEPTDDGDAKEARASKSPT